MTGRPEQEVNKLAIYVTARSIFQPAGVYCSPHMHSAAMRTGPFNAEYTKLPLPVTLSVFVRMASTIWAVTFLRGHLPLRGH